MTFKNLIRSVERYVKMEGNKVHEMIKDFINDSVEEFVRLSEWEKVKVSAAITLDDSGSYDLSALLTNRFDGELALLDSDGVEFQKCDYKRYLQLSSKDEFYSLLGNILYVEGDGEVLTLIYVTSGENYPLSDDSDEVPATQYYANIIKQMTVVKLLGQIGDEMTEKEAGNLDRMLAIVKKHENRIDKQGKAKVIQRGV